MGLINSPNSVPGGRCTVEVIHVYFHHFIGLFIQSYKIIQHFLQEISELRRIVSRLENEKDTYRRDMDDLRGELNIKMV